MVYLELSCAHYSLLLQSLQSHMDYLTTMIHNYSNTHNSEMVTILKDEFSDAYELYIKLKNTSL